MEDILLAIYCTLGQTFCQHKKPASYSKPANSTNAATDKTYSDDAEQSFALLSLL